MSDYAKLRALAEAATPGDWRTSIVELEADNEVQLAEARKDRDHCHTLLTEALATITDLYHRDVADGSRLVALLDRIQEELNQ
jgi:hypothetical protein